MTKINHSSQPKQLKAAILQRIFSSKGQSDTSGPKSIENRAISTSPKAAVEQSKKSRRFLKNPSHVKSPVASNLAEATNNNDGEVKTSKKKRESQVEKMRNRLSVGQFRYISEQLYTQSSNEASDLFRQRPELYHAYHRGYVRQQRQWPSNPLDAIISELQQEVKLLEESDSPSSFTIADFGCGEARLARTLTPKGASTSRSSANVTVHSFDFVASNEHVVACDMAHTNLPNASVDVVVFCLSLMGTNVNDFLLEASRVLKNGGRLRIAEVRSRFDSVAKFIKKLKGFGFKLIELRGSDASSFFTHFNFVKVSPVKKAKVSITLAPCIYKKR